MERKERERASEREREGRKKGGSEGRREGGEKMRTRKGWRFVITSPVMPTYGLLENSSPARSRECQSKPSKQKIQETWEKEV
jgi:hypothetical protein